MKRSKLPETWESSGDCRAFAEILARIGDKWSVLVVTKLMDGTRRFNELQRALSGISQKMLTATLRGLERDGFITRTIYPTVPPKVEYSLTELGQRLADPLKSLGEFAIANQPRIEAARERFDRGATAQPLDVSVFIMTAGSGG
jgi:DNA-binding HxlR family transcriptional regulator